MTNRRKTRGGEVLDTIAELLLVGGLAAIAWKLWSPDGWGPPVWLSAGVAGAALATFLDFPFDPSRADKKDDR